MHKQGTQGAEYINYTNFQKDRLLPVMDFETQLFSTLKGFTRCYGAFSSHNQEHRGEPLLFAISAPGSFTCVTQHKV